MPKIKSSEETNEQLKGDLRKTKEELAIQKWGNEKTLEGMKVLVKELIQKGKELGKFKLAVDNVSDQIIITDPDATVLYTNNATEKITGYTTEEAMGGKAGKLWGNLMERSFYENLWKTIKIDKKTFVGEIINQRKNNQTYTALISISPILDAKGEVEFFVGIEHDITKEKEIDKAKTEFVSLASHQLRTPLTGIQWVAERFAKKEKLSSEGKEYLNDIIMATKRLAILIELLLNVTRIEEGKIGIVPRPVELVGLVKRFLQECHPLGVKNSLTLQFEKHPAILEIISDENVLRNIIQAIVSNAIEYTPRGGRVDVALEKKESTFLFTVSDTGIGIPKKDQPFVFKKLFRGSNATTIKTDGTGLGLYIAFEATKFLDGKIWFESPTVVETKAGKEENKGTTFYIELPLKVERKAGEKSLA